MTSYQFRIDYTITRRRLGEGDFTEVGFGSSGATSSIDQAAHLLQSAVENREWETSHGMPDPDDVEDDGDAWGALDAAMAPVVAAAQEGGSKGE